MLTTNILLLITPKLLDKITVLVVLGSFLKLEKQKKNEFLTFTKLNTIHNFGYNLF